MILCCREQRSHEGYSGPVLDTYVYVCVFTHPHHCAIRSRQFIIRLTGYYVGRNGYPFGVT